MSTPETLFTAPRPPLGLRMTARAAVAVAFLLARLPPVRIQRLLTVARAGAAPATHDQAKTARDAVIAVSTVCAGKGCLPRSVATALVCRSRGVWPVWKVGARTAPFAAHAWVEAQGRAVDEGPDMEAFGTLLTVGPAGPGAREQCGR